MYNKIRMLALMCLVFVIALAMLNGVAMAGEGSDAKASPTCYTVCQGDTVYRISRMYGIKPDKLMAFNGLETSKIVIGEKIYIPTNGKEAVTTMAGLGLNVTGEELHLLAKLIHAEARGESFAGKVAVGAVILNRINNPEFPKSISEVIMQKNNQVYQFSPVGDGSINLEPDESSKQAALEALKGEDPTNGALYFYNPRCSSDKWIRTLPVLVKIGNHLFAATKA